MWSNAKRAAICYGQDSSELKSKLKTQGLEKFAKYLCQQTVQRIKMLIHLDSGNINFKNQNSRESVYDFFYVQQDYDKLLKIKLNFGADYDSYVSEYLMSVKVEDIDRFDIFTNKNSKFYF